MMIKKWVARYATHFLLIFYIVPNNIVKLIVNNERWIVIPISKNKDTYLTKVNIHKFIEWICVNFDMDIEDTLIRDIERKTRTYLDAEKQIK